MCKISSIFLCLPFILAVNTAKAPEYIRQCRRNDPNLTDCLRSSIEHLKPFLLQGIPEIELKTVEPFIIDTLTLQLSEGPQGYKITLMNAEVYGLSNFEVRSLKLNEDGSMFKSQVYVPKLRIEAKYTSSGVLFVIRASGGGEFHATFDGFIADITGKTSTRGDHLHLDNLKLDIGFKDVEMSVASALNSRSSALHQGINLFLKDNAQAVVEVMQPQLQQKLAREIGKLLNNILKHVPIEDFYSN